MKLSTGTIVDVNIINAVVDEEPEKQHDAEMHQMRKSNVILRKECAHWF